MKIKPFNLILQNTNIVTENNKPLQIKNELYNEILKLREKNKKRDEKVIPISQCNINWDYKRHGDDWNCMVKFKLSSVNVVNDSRQLT
jgi:hypothetical protein